MISIMDGGQIKQNVAAANEHAFKHVRGGLSLAEPGIDRPPARAKCVGPVAAAERGTALDKCGFVFLNIPAHGT